MEERGFQTEKPKWQLLEREDRVGEVIDELSLEHEAKPKQKGKSQLLTEIQENEPEGSEGQFEEYTNQ